MCIEKWMGGRGGGTADVKWVREMWTFDIDGEMDTGMITICSYLRPGPIQGHPRF
jgi:hypothetical protein